MKKPEFYLLLPDSPKFRIEGFNQLMWHQRQATKSPRDLDHIQKATELAIRNETPARCFVAAQGEQLLVGALISNIGVGIQTGGYYLWINDIHIMESHRNMGIGTKLLQFVTNWARENDCLYMAASRDTDNLASQQLFANAGWQQNEMTWMDTRLVT